MRCQPWGLWSVVLRVQHNPAISNSQSAVSPDTMFINTKYGYIETLIISKYLSQSPEPGASFEGGWGHRPNEKEKKEEKLEKREKRKKERKKERMEL